MEYFLPFLIFASLGVIIFIVGKHLSEFKKIGQFREQKKDERKSVEKFKSFFCKTGSLLKTGFFCLIEWFVKKIKQFLHSVHFWILKNKKKRISGEDEIAREIEIKKELIEAEEKNLEMVIEDDLTEEVKVDIQKDFSFLGKERKDVGLEENPQIEKEEEKTKKQENFSENFFVEVEEEIENQEEDFSEEEKENKIKTFFSKKDNKEEDEKFPKNVWGKMKNIFTKFSWRKAEMKNGIEENDFREIEKNESFSDGVVGVSDGDFFQAENVDEDNLIKEVVSIKKEESVDIDEEIGVDRKILEKKLIQKIANNPKDVENYRELGELYIKMKNFIDAEECYKQILKIHLRDVDAKRKIEKIKLLKRMN